MATCYRCNRCGVFETNKFCDIKKHCIRKNPCKKKNDFLFLSDDQILALTLIPYQNNSHIISENDTLHLKNYNVLEKNKKELFNELDTIEKNKVKICKYCNQEFTLITDLKKHIILNCFFKEAEKKEELKKNKENITNNIENSYNNCDINVNSSVGTLNSTTNNTNNTTNNTTNNNINIYLEIKNPIPFDNDWDLSKISESEKTKIMVSKVMYTKLLENILKNEINLNVIIDKDKDLGMVYKNDTDKYIQMNAKDIVATTMEKLNAHLNEINKNDSEVFNEVIDFTRKMINKKFIDFQNNTTVQENVGNFVCDIFETKRMEAINMAKNVVKISKFDGY
jgi:hypothetical protein